MRAEPAIAALLLSGAAGTITDGPPPARKVPVTDVYHGVKVVDEYRWLENGEDPTVKRWSEAQNAWARTHLDRLPGVDVLRAQVTRIRKIAVPRYGLLRFAGSALFALKVDPPRQQPLLVALSSEDDPASARVVVDPNALDPSGGTSIDWFVPSPDGSRVAVSLSRGGSERGDAHVFEVATGKEVGEAVPRVNYGTALGSLAWDADGAGFFYTRYPREGERPAADLDFYVQVYHHRIGAPTAGDRYEIGKEFPRIAEVWLDRSPDGRFVLANVQNGDGGEFAQHLRSADGRWTPLTTFADRVVHAVFGVDDALYLLSRAGAPRGKVLRLSLAAEPLRLDRATTLVPEGEGVVEFSFFGPSGIVPARGRVFVVEGIGGPQRIRSFDLMGREQTPVPVPPVSAVYALLAKPGGHAILFQSASFLEPTAWYRWEGTGAPVKTALSPTWPLFFGDAEVVREEALSRDGTRLPLSIVRRKGTKRDGTSPTLLTGYGGYGISQTPYFDPGLRVWLDGGGVFALASLRGGGEFGEEWHRAGTLTRKQNVFDDFIACAEHLVRAGYTSPARLAIEGGSNGGLLVGAALTQRPDLFRAVVAHVGIYDMLRVELSPNGAFNVPEFGTVKDAAQFQAMLAYSPYHRVAADARRYPAVLMLTGANDPRVDPMQSRKMVARLQAAGAPLVLLRTSAASGHGFGTSLDEQIEEEVDVRAFLFDRLGLEAPRPPAES
jgi:prolyl oligopeptidase